MQVFNESVQRLLWITNFGQRLELTVQFLDPNNQWKDHIAKVKQVVTSKINAQHFMNVEFKFVENNGVFNVNALTQKLGSQPPEAAPA